MSGGGAGRRPPDATGGGAEAGSGWRALGGGGAMGAALGVCSLASWVSGGAAAAVPNPPGEWPRLEAVPPPGARPERGLAALPRPVGGSLVPPAPGAAPASGAAPAPRGRAGARLQLPRF